MFKLFFISMVAFCVSCSNFVTAAQNMQNNGQSNNTHSVATCQDACTANSMTCMCKCHKERHDISSCGITCIDAMCRCKCHHSVNTVSTPNVCTASGCTMGPQCKCRCHYHDASGCGRVAHSLPVSQCPCKCHHNVAGCKMGYCQFGASCKCACHTNTANTANTTNTTQGLVGMGNTNNTGNRPFGS